jgi:hypothetical protein
MVITLRSLPLALLAFASIGCGWAAEGIVSGQLTDPQGKPVVGARIRLISGANAKTVAVASGPNGRFVFGALSDGTYQISAAAAGFVAVKKTFHIGNSEALTLDLQFTGLAPRTETVAVTADVTQLDIQQPDPAQRINVREDILDANPGRPGAPVSIPGLPVETASGGLKAPQYFAPGVAGDHGEPVAQFLQVGSYLVPTT